MAEIAIVGGGPSGAMCGEQLARAGNNVTIFDEHLAWKSPAAADSPIKQSSVSRFSSIIPTPKN